MNPIFVTQRDRDRGSLVYKLENKSKERIRKRLYVLVNKTTIIN